MAIQLNSVKSVAISFNHRSLTSRSSEKDKHNICRSVIADGRYLGVITVVSHGTRRCYHGNNMHIPPIMLPNANEDDVTCVVGKLAGITD